jgi:hypothetical protein
MPRISFNFLVCSYLPGLPLATIIYWLALRGHYDKGQNDYYFVLYFLIAPLFIGLFIDGFRHFLEETRKFERLFWVYPSIDEIPRIVENRGRESLEQYERTLDKLYPMYEHFWNTWISSAFTLFIGAFYFLFVDMSILDNSAIKFFAIVIVLILLFYIPLASKFRTMQAGLASKIITPMPGSKPKSKSEQ